MPLFDGSILKALGHPIAGKIVETLSPPVIEAIRTATDAGDLGRKLEKAAAENPEVKNNLNLEPPIRSGVTVGNGLSLAALGPAIGLCVYQLLFTPTHTITQEAFMAAFALMFVGAGGSIYSLYRRWAPNLPFLGAKKE